MSELPSCTSDKVRKARKKHKCCECQNPIDIGENYHYLSGIWNGEPKDYKTCMGCRELREYAYSFARDMQCNDEEYPALGEIHYWISEYEITPEQLERMFALDLSCDDAL